MRSELAAVDVAVVVLYVLGTFLLGAWFARKQGSTRTYFVGDRDVAWWLVLASIVATETSTVTFLGVPGLAFDSDPNRANLTFLQLALGFALGRVAIAWLLLPQYLRGELLSAYQLLRQRFDAGVQRTASAIFLCTRAIADGLRLYLTALLLWQFTGWDPYASVLVLAGVTIAYTYLGGMEAVLWTDLVQLLVYLLGAAVAGLCIVRMVPGGWEGYVAVGEEAGKFTWLNLSPSPTQPYTLWAGLIGGAFVTMASHGADQMMVQRYLCSRSLGQARLALVLSGVVVLLQFLLFLLLGVGLFVLVREDAFPGLRWVLMRDGRFALEGARQDQVFGLFIVRFLPHGVVGLVVAAVLAVGMSTLASSLNSAANASVADFYKPLRPGLPERSYLRVARGMTLLWGLVRVGVALGALAWQSDRSIVDQVLTVAAVTTGLVLGLFLLGSMRRPVRSGAALAGLVAGFLAVLLAWAPLFRGGSGARASLLAWPWYPVVGALTTVAVALAVDLVLNVRRDERGPSGDRGTEPGLGEAR
jgi:solute:Na+ symporter, SSS family